MDLVGAALGLALGLTVIASGCYLAFRLFEGGLKNSVVREGRQLELKFIALNPLVGKTKSDIFAAVGQPDHTLNLEDGKVVHAWKRPGYTIALHFDASGLCEGVTTER